MNDPVLFRPSCDLKPDHSCIRPHHRQGDAETLWLVGLSNVEMAPRLVKVDDDDGRAQELPLGLG